MFVHNEEPYLCYINYLQKKFLNIKISKNMKRTLCILFLLMVSISAVAADFYSGGIAYDITTEETVEVVKSSKLYSGDIVVPSTVRHQSKTYSVTSIDTLAFAYSYLTSVIIGDSVTRIESHAFMDCYNLKNVVLSNTLTHLESYAFSGCHELKKIEIPNTVNAIEDGVFSYCEKLASVVLPESLESIGNNAFKNCYSLSSINISNTIKTIGKGAFEACGCLTSFKIPNKLKRIEDNMFSGCSNLKILTIPNSVETIGNDAFSDCNNLVTLIIGNSVTSIGERAFQNCYRIEEIYSLNPVPPMICSNSFTTYFDCPDLYVSNGSMNMYKRTQHWSIFKQKFELEFSNSGVFESNGLIYNISETNANEASVLRLLKSEETDLVIPEHAVGDSETYNVTYISAKAFMDCENIIKMEIPNTVKSIGDRAFYGCKGLTSITIPNSVVTIDHNAFRDCAGLVSVTIGNSVTSIGTRAFKGCSNLKTIYSLNVVPPEIYLYTFDSFTADLIVPSGYLETYKDNIYWKLFISIYEDNFGSVEWNDAGHIRVKTHDGDIEISGAQEERVEVYNLKGQCLYSGKEKKIHLGCGIYIVNVAGTMHKVSL